jgi:hypothetical protein
MGARSAWATAGSVFAGTMMLIIGAYQIFMGIAAIAKDSFFLRTPNYLYDVDTTAWGWIHLGLGALIALAGFFVFTGALWARAIGIALAVLSAVANFFFIPYYPLWSLLIIALDIFAIWALATVGRRTPAPEEMMSASAAGMAAPGGGSGGRWSTTNPDYANPEMAARRAPDVSGAGTAGTTAAGMADQASSTAAGMADSAEDAMTQRRPGEHRAR